MRAYVLLMLVLLAGASTVPGRVNAQEASKASADPQPSSPPDTAAAPDSPSWLFPVAKLDESLPSWLHIGGEYRNRVEGPISIGYASTRDFYLLDRLRVNATIQPKPWLRFHGQVQDSRIFFNYHVSNGNPYEDSWTLWEAYPQVGSSTAGWVDVLAGRQVLLFGDERVIGPSNWLNVGRTFNVARIDLHHPEYNVSVFAASVIPGDNTDLHNAPAGQQSIRSLRKLPEHRSQGQLRALCSLARRTCELGASGNGWAWPPR